MRYRRIAAITLTVLLALSLCPNPAGADGALTLTNGADNGIISVTCSYEMNGTLAYDISREGVSVNRGEFDVSDTNSAEIGLPVRRLPLNEYTVTVSLYVGRGRNTRVAETAAITLTTGVDASVITNGSETLGNSNPIDQVRAVLVPYAEVFDSAALTGEPVVKLKRHDLVTVLSVNGNIAHIQYWIQSGNGYTTKVDKINAEYHSDDDFIGTGYMSTEAFILPDTKAAIDLQREVVELAYNRLGIRGVYSQGRRCEGWYVDCSALACWLWYQVGIETFNGTATACNGIAGWANGEANNVIRWAATEDYDNAQDAIALIKTDNGITEDVGFGVDDYYGAYLESDVLDYADTMPREVWDSLEPGDLLLFNKAESLVYNEIDFGMHCVNQGHASQSGYDHVAVFVGYASRGGGEVDYDTITVIEAMGPSDEASRNTVINTISVAGARHDQIRMVVSPLGCERVISVLPAT